jgi:hypothetical protein
MKRRIVILTAVVVVFSMSLVAGAGLALDPAAMSGWRDTLDFNSGALVAQVQYAVYAPGMYHGSISIPSGHYTYAYQLYNVGGNALTSFKVNMVNGSGAMNGSIDTTYGDSSGVAPLMVNVVNEALESSFYALYMIAQLQPGAHSVVLLYTSPNGPTTTEASVADGGLISASGAPAPLPEPATLILLGLSGLALRRKRFLRHTGCGIIVKHRTAIARAAT